MAVFLHFTAKTARRKQEIAEASGPSSLFAMGRRFWLSRLPGSRRVASLRLGLETAAYAASVSRPRSGPSSLFAMGRRFWLSRLPGSRRVASLRLGLETAAYAASVSRPRSGPSPLFAAGRRFLEKFMDYLFFKCSLLWYNNE